MPTGTPKSPPVCSAKKDTTKVRCGRTKRKGAWADQKTHLVIIEEPEDCVRVEVELPLRDAQVLHECGLHDLLELFDGESEPLRNVVECLP
jgi:hypothetical protein